MKRFLIPLLIVLSGANALATDFEGTFGIQPGLGGFPFTAQIALSNINVLENPDLNLGFVFSTQRIEASLNAGFEFGPLGRASSDTSFDVLFGGVRFKSNFRGTLGPIALELEAGFWTISSYAMSGWAAFDRNQDSFTRSGFLLGANAQYRLSRNVTVKLGGRYVPESSRVSVGVETRAGEFTLTAGVLFAPQTANGEPVVPQVAGLTYGATFGVKYLPENLPLRVGLEAFIGSNPLGFTGGGLLDISLDFLNIDEEKISTLSAYVAFEPWREDISFFFRFGTTYEFNLGAGVVVVRGFGGINFNNDFGYGLSLGYRISWDNLFGI